MSVQARKDADARMSRSYGAAPVRAVGEAGDLSGLSSTVASSALQVVLVGSRHSGGSDGGDVACLLMRTCIGRAFIIISIVNVVIVILFTIWAVVGRVCCAHDKINK